MITSPLVGEVVRMKYERKRGIKIIMALAFANVITLLPASMMPTSPTRGEVI
jgi:hypothetical protein